MDFGSTLLPTLLPAILPDLINASIRAFLLAGIGAFAIWVCRIRTAAGRHAVWTLVAAGMLLGPFLSPILPPLSIRVLRAVDIRPAIPAPAVFDRAAPHGAHSSQLTSDAGLSWWELAGAALYGVVTLVFFTRLALGWLFIRRLVRTAKTAGDEHHYESSWVCVPIAAGWIRPRIILPLDWREWSRRKLDSVLAHEEAHVRRWDCAIQMLARLNRCVFWFHPLAWWLERRIASLAEEACDDTALSLVSDRHQYAQALLDMARAVRSNDGRLMWHAIAMAKGVEVTKRIDRILDETRPVPRFSGRAFWVALVLCGLPLIYVASTARLRAQDPSSPRFRTAEAQPGASPEARLDARWQEWLNVEAAYIITDQERAAFRKLKTDDERQQFTEQFWLRRDPTPDTQRNEFKEEHDRRLAYVNANYTTAANPGWRTDRGRSYILYGPPDEKEAHPSGNIVTRFPTEAWRYHVINGVGNNVTFLFSDPNRTGDYTSMLDPSTIVYRLGKGTGITPPSLVYKREPDYTEGARTNKLQGTTVLSVVVGPDGMPYDIAVVQSLDPGLDQKAIDAVRQWRFNPGRKEDQPVAVTAKIEVNFRLM